MNFKTNLITLVTTIIGSCTIQSNLKPKAYETLAHFSRYIRPGVTLIGFETIITNN